MSDRFENETFRGCEPTWANACVGDNGSPGIRDYAEGFADAAKVLVEQVLDNRGLNYPTDTFVYPICFNMRHAIELYLKDAIEQLRSLGHHDIRFEEIDVQTSHDIGKLWGYFKRHSALVDRRYKTIVNSLDRNIGDFAEVDATGQVFRYPFGRDSKKHLTRISIINVGVLWRNFSKMIEDLKALSYLGLTFLEEYRHETYTAHLSRFDLVCISFLLPVRSLWATEELDAAKAKIRKCFQISSNEFCRALKAVQANREMASIIDARLPFAHLTEQQLHTYFDIWGEYHDLSKIRKIYDGSRVLEEVGLDLDFEFDGLKAVASRRGETRRTQWDVLKENISAEAFAEISALLYFARDRLTYAEAYEQAVALSTQEFLAQQRRGDDEYRRGVFHVVEKVSGFAYVLNSLQFFGHTEFVDGLLRRLGMQEYKNAVLADCIGWFRIRRNQVQAALNEEPRCLPNAVPSGTRCDA